MLSPHSYTRDPKNLAAITISINGSDWETGYLFNLKSGKQLSDTLRNLKGGNIEWYGNHLYFDAYDSPKVGRELLDKGTAQSCINYLSIKQERSQKYSIKIQL